MGNQHSSTESDIRRAFRGGNTLGLNRNELDKRCQPSGLYNDCPWDDRAIRKLVGDGKVAARLKGGDGRSTDADQECPICFLFYSELNITKCCSANICTECYLQVRPQKEKQSTCPFCNNQKLAVTVAKNLSPEQIQERLKDEQHVIAAQIRSATAKKDDEDDLKKEKAVNSPKDGFGSSLEQDSRVALFRKRSESLASEHSDGNGSSCNDEAALIRSLAMTPEERRRLEEEMRAQHSHPVAQRIEAEAQERRLQNDRAYYGSQSGQLRAQRAAEQLFARSSRRRNRAARDWNHIVESFERGGHGEIHSLDDLVVLEAAIVLSMEEEQRRSRHSTDSDTNDFDAARHARDGFPLVRSFFANRGRDEATQDEIQTLARTLSSSRRRNQLMRGQRASSASNMPDTALDTAALLMRGITEEEQLAMAIAASLQDQGTNNEDSSATTGNDSERAAEEEHVVEAVEEEEDEDSESESEHDEVQGSQTLENRSAGGSVAVGVLYDDSTQDNNSASRPDPEVPAEPQRNSELDGGEGSVAGVARSDAADGGGSGATHGSAKTAGETPSEMRAAIAIEEDEDVVAPPNPPASPEQPISPRAFQRISSCSERQPGDLTSM